MPLVPATCFNGSFSGNALADMILGDAYEYTEVSPHVEGPLYWTDYSFYFQDRYRATPRLTITPGIRWEFIPPEEDTKGNLSYFNPNRFNAAQAATVLPNGQIVSGTQNFLNGVVVAGQSNPYGDAATNTVHDALAPRFGLAYSLTKDNLTVLRAGYGLFYDRWAQYADAVFNSYPWAQSASVFDTSLDNPAEGTHTIFPITLISFQSPWEIPYYQKWSMDVQRQLPRDVLLDVGYIGSAGRHLISSFNINQPLTTSVAVASGTISANSVVPYHGLGAITTYETNRTSSYNSLQVSATRRFASGMFFQGSYTYSKSMDDVIAPNNAYAPLSTFWAPSSFDRTHVFVLSYVYNLPFARHAQGWRHAIAGGSQGSGITSFESGVPSSVTISSDRAGTGMSSEFANVVGTVAGPRTLGEWFNTSAFALPTLGTYGHAARDLIRGPGINNWDFSLSKQSRLNERLGLELRAEFFNIFNHAQFSSLTTLVGSPTFGELTAAKIPGSFSSVCG